MVTAMAAPTFQRATLAARLRPRHLRIFSSMSGGGGETRRQLVLYSKPGCCLCDGLKEKLSVAFSLGGPHSLHSVDLQVRDITVNPEWEQKYQYEIPVLAKVLPDGTEPSSLSFVVFSTTTGMLLEHRQVWGLSWLMKCFRDYLHA